MYPPYLRRQIELLFQRTDGREISDARECANVRVHTCKHACNVNVTDEDEEKEEEEEEEEAVRDACGARRASA